MTAAVDDRPPEARSLSEALEASGAPVHTTLGVRRILAPDAERGRGCEPGCDPARRVCQRKADWRRS